MARLHVLFHQKDGSLKRSSVENVDLNAGVDTLKHLISKQIEVTPDEIDLIFRGQKLNDGSLSSLKSGHSVCVMHTNKRNDDMDVSQSQTNFGVRDYAALLNTLRLVVRRTGSSFRARIEEITQREGFMSEMKEKVPGLADDSFSQNALRDPELLFTFLEMHEQIAPKHPCLYKAAQIIVEQLSTSRSNTQASGTYSMDAMFEEEEEAGQAPQLRVSDGAQGGSITAADLQAALALAAAIPQERRPQTAQRQQSQPQAGQSSAGSQPSAAQQLFNTQMLQQAIQQATSGAFTEQLKQMRELGIVDEARAIQALQLTNGNVEAAVNLIFSDQI